MKTKTKKKEELKDYIIRKFLKKDAKKRTKSPIYITYIIMIILVIGLELLLIPNFINNRFHLPLHNLLRITISGIIITIITTYFMIGIKKACLTLCKSKKIEIKQILTYPLKNINIYLKLLILNISLYIITTVFLLIPIIGPILYLILMIYLLPILSITTYIVIDKEETLDNAITQSTKLLKEKKTLFYSLILSFTGWLILSILTLGLLTIWFIPYLTTTITNYYLYISDQKKINKRGIKEGLSNKLIIILGIIIWIIISIITILLLIKYPIEITKDNNYNYNYNNTNNDNNYNNNSNCPNNNDCYHYNNNNCINDNCERNDYNNNYNHNYKHNAR